MVLEMPSICGFSRKCSKGTPSTKSTRDRNVLKNGSNLVSVICKCPFNVISCQLAIHLLDRYLIIYFSKVTILRVLTYFLGAILLKLVHS